MQRSARSAFDNLSAYQSCHAWIALRPFVEAALIMGKWVDDPQNATIWISRNAGKNARKQYQDAYSGDSLRSQHLPGSDTIRQVLSRIGDEFLQTNLHFYTHAMNFRKPTPGKPHCEWIPWTTPETTAHTSTRSST